MKRYTFILFLLFISFSLSAQLTAKLDDQMNFDLTLKDIVIMVETGKSNTIDMDKYIILDGVVSNTEVLVSDKENFQAIFEITYGEWEGLENVVVYKCFIQVQGLDFAPLLPARRSRTPDPAEITLNDHLMILGKYLGYSEDEAGKKHPVVEGIKIRKIN